MINPNQIFKVIFNSPYKPLIKHLTQVPNLGDKVRYQNKIFEVTEICWGVDSYMPEDTGHQAVIIIEIKNIGEVTL